MKSRIAVLGLSPATTEVAKNLVLKALNVDFFDSGLVDETTVQGNFLMSSEDIGKTVFFLSDEKAKAVEDIFRDMNPIVKIGSHGSVDIDSLGDEGELKLAEYDLWIVDGLSLAQIVIQSSKILEGLGLSSQKIKQTSILCGLLWPSCLQLLHSRSRVWSQDC